MAHVRVCSKCLLEKPACAFLARGQKQSVNCRDCRGKWNRYYKGYLDANPGARRSLTFQNDLNKVLTGRRSMTPRVASVVGCDLPSLRAHFEGPGSLA